MQRLFLLLLILTNYICTSQKAINPTAEDVELSKSLKEKYPDDDVAITESVEVINFAYDKKSENITVKHSHQIKFINIGAHSTIPLFIFYDDQSYVNALGVSYRNERPTNIYFKDDYYSNEEMFHTDARVRWSSLDFPLKGYRYTLRYRKDYKDVKYFVSTYLDDLYPIISKKIVVHVPDWLELDIKEMNFEGYSITKEVTVNQKEKSTTYTFTIENIAATAREESAPGPTYYRPHLLFLAKSHTQNENKTRLFTNTNDLYKWYNSLVLEMNENPSTLKEKTLSLIEDCKTEKEKIKKIYYWIQDNIRYIAFEDGIAGFKPDESQNVYKKKYGDCKGMANLTKQMLRIAGFDARLTWIGTKRIAYDYSLPTIAVDNHMICTVILDDTRYFLDATEKYNSFGNYAERIQNKQVLIEDDENFILDSIPSSTAQQNSETYIANLFIENEILKGSISRNYEGESKSHFLYNINNLRTDKRDQALAWYINQGDKNLLSKNIEVSDINDRDGKLQLNYEIEQSNAVSSFDKEVYLDLDYYKEYKNLEMEKRKTDYLFPYKVLENTIINLTIPDGYSVKELPENLIITNQDFDISLRYEKINNQIKYSKNIHFKNAKISKTQLKLWREFNSKLKKQYQKQIILSKN